MKITVELSRDEGTNTKTINVIGPWDPEEGLIQHSITLPENAPDAQVDSALLRAINTIGPEFSQKLSDFIAAEVEPPVEPEPGNDAGRVAGLRIVAVDGDSENMRKLFERAIELNRDVKIDYTDAREQSTKDRVITPLSFEWIGAGDAPSRAIKVRDAGTLKTFYLYRMDRAEIL